MQKHLETTMNINELHIGDEIRIENYPDSAYSGRIVKILTTSAVRVHWYIHVGKLSAQTVEYTCHAIGTKGESYFYRVAESKPLTKEEQIINKIKFLDNKFKQRTSS